MTKLIDDFRNFANASMSTSLPKIGLGYGICHGAARPLRRPISVTLCSYRRVLWTATVLQLSTGVLRDAWAQLLRYAGSLICWSPT